MAQAIDERSIPNVAEDVNRNNSADNNDKAETGKVDTQHYDLCSLYVNQTIHNLKTNLDTLLTLQGSARELFENLIQEQVDIGWRHCSHPRFVGLPGTNLLLKLAMELRDQNQGNMELYEEVASALQTLNIWIELKFKIDEELDDKLVLTCYLFIKDNSSIFQNTLDVMIPKKVDDLVPLVCIANEMVISAMKTFSMLLSVTCMQLCEHDAMPQPKVPKFKHPEFEKGKENDNE